MERREGARRAGQGALREDAGPRGMNAALPRRSRGRVVGAGVGLAVALAGVTLPSAPAFASGYLVARFGGDHGTPASPNPFAVYFNPAAMGGTQGTNLTLDVAPILRFVEYTRGADALGNPTLADPNNRSPEAERYRQANTGKASLTNVLALGFLGLTTDLGLKTPLRFGYAAYVPFGGLAQWDKRTDPIASDPLAPGAQDGVQRWHNINGKILSIYNTLAMSYTVEPLRLSFGANVSLALHEIDTVRARNIPDNGDEIQAFDGRFNEGRTRLVAHGFNVGAAFGVYWEPLADRSIKLGVSYTSSPGFGRMRLDGDLTAQAGSNPETAEPSKVQLLQTYPDIVRFGGGWRLSKHWELRSDFEVVRWSMFDRQCVVAPGAECNINPDGSSPNAVDIVLNIPRNFKDSFGARIGGAYFVNPDLELFGSVAGTTSAIPPARMDASAIDANRLYVSAGARYVFSEHFALAGSANWIHFFQVDTKGTARTDRLLNPSRSPSANGVYTSEIFVLNLNGTYTF